MSLRLSPAKSGSIRRLLRDRWLVAILVASFLASSFPSPVFAQSPATWQQNATGLLTSSNPNKMTAGLTLRVQDQGWPFLSTQGGVLDDGYGMAMGPVGIDLGLVEIPTATSSALTAESADWAHDSLTYNGGTANEIDLTASRLSPALLLDVPNSGATTLRLLAGNVHWYVSHDQTGLNDKLAPASPKWVAFSSGGTPQTDALTSSPTSLPGLDNNWLLVWFGTNSYFDDTMIPYPYPFPQSPPNCCNLNTGSIPYANIYQADAPLLVHFQTNPTAISQSPNGGIDLTFNTTPGDLTIMPLYGRLHPNAATTDAWGAAGLPSDALQRIAFWTSHLCSFPQTAAEGYSYASSTDTTTISENVTYVPACGASPGIQLAPLPPMLAVARAQLPITFSGPVVDANLPTDFGPLQGIENTTSYTWSMTGLGVFQQDERTLGTSPVPSDIMTLLVSQVNQIVQAGHFEPWFVPGKMPRQPYTGDLYFDNPADTLAILADIIPVLPDPQKTNLISYLRSERANYPPETVYSLPMGQGTPRSGFALPDQAAPGGDLYAVLPSNRPDVFLTRVPLYNFYALARYYDITGDTIPTSVLTAAQSVLNTDMPNHDWATGSWFYGFGDRKTAVENANRFLDGAIGLARLSQASGDSATHTLAMGILLRATVLRVGMAHYPRWLYSVGLVSLPNDPNWQPKALAGSWIGKLANYGWSGPGDDARQVVVLDQFGLLLHDSAGYSTGSGVYSSQTPGTMYAYLPAFRDLVPESAAILRDYAKSDVDIPIAKYTAEMPAWYAAFSETPLGDEHGIAYPIDAYSLFMAKTWIDGETPNNLAHYADVPWLSNGGDFFYVAKLAETVRAYQDLPASTSVTLAVQK